MKKAAFVLFVLVSIVVAHFTWQPNRDEVITRPARVYSHNADCSILMLEEGRTYIVAQDLDWGNYTVTIATCGTSNTSDDTIINIERSDDR